MMRHGNPCNCSFGNVINRVPCSGAPHHAGAHHNRDAGLRWADGGRAVRRCTWAECTEPDRQLQDGDGITLHLCPGKPADQSMGAILAAEGWQ